MAGTGWRAASVGSQIWAASNVPSDIGMKTSRSTLTRRGNFLLTAILTLRPLKPAAAPSGRHLSRKIADWLQSRGLARESGVHGLDSEPPMRYEQTENILKRWRAVRSPV